MDKCRKCGQEGEIRDLLCFTCTQQVKALRSIPEQRKSDEADKEAQVA